VINNKRQKPFVATLICAAFAAQFSLQVVNAAVPIEESVEDSRRDALMVAQSQDQQPVTRPSDSARSLDIPPTIEPTVNTDYNTQPRPAPIVVSPGGATAPAVSGGQSQLSELFYQLQILQQEIQDLRGQVEEQTYLVNRLQRDQKEQYLDLDRRLIALTGNQPAPGPSSTTPAATPRTPVSGSLSEREAYTQAFDAMRARDFENSMVGFQNLIERYPNGQFTANAYYWIGELYLVAQTDAELARQSFMQVVTLYPDHQKAPDALYKLGVVYHTLGDDNSARQYLERVQREHPSSSAAGLASKYAAELQ
jgi:tol-pal system protein YbgF